MFYEGPIYRPPSEADSLLIQATVGCPHNRCTFCMVYKNGPRFRARDVEEIKEDIREAAHDFGSHVTTLFFPAGNTIAMKTEDLAEICRYSREMLPNLQRITVYGSSQYIYRKGPDELKQLAAAGLSRIHVGMESGDDVILRQIKKGSTGQIQREACQMAREAGIEVSVYVILGIGGAERSEVHARETARALNLAPPDFIRLRTFVPKQNTPLLNDVINGSFNILGPHGVLRETEMLIRELTLDSQLTSDHYTNYINIEGKLPQDKGAMLEKIQAALMCDESTFRPFFVGKQ